MIVDIWLLIYDYSYMICRYMIKYMITDIWFTDMITVIWYVDIWSNIWLEGSTTTTTVIVRLCYKTIYFTGNLTVVITFSTVSQVSWPPTYRRRDVIEYISIRCHVNILVDPSTGHMLQTLQIVWII